MPTMEKDKDKNIDHTWEEETRGEAESRCKSVGNGDSQESQNHLGEALLSL